MSAESDRPLAFGIHASTGCPLGERLHQDLTLQAEERLQTLTGDLAPQAETFGTEFGYDADDLADVGWGMVFASDVDPELHLQALDQLVTLRREQARDKFRIFSGADGYRAGETASAWLNRHGASLNLMTPENGVPYYLTIIGPPSEIPFEFQYSLDIVAAVGRLDFPTHADYTSYASSVTSFENDTTRMTSRQIELFATCHDFDRATQLFTKQVAIPLSKDKQGDKPFGTKYGFSMNATLNECATKDALLSILSNSVRAPSILFTGTHGMVFGADDDRQMENQGALVCQDWPGYGDISETHWFAAGDVPANANVHGLIHFFFACYGAGTPEFDNFSASSNDRRIVPAPMTSRLPQKLMTLPQGGVLASLGHIDRAWASSFQNNCGVAQAQGFRDVISRLLAGQRIGYATDQFNGQWGVLSAELVRMLNDKAYGKAIRETDLLALRIARDDCRNYVVLGDPAVKLRPYPDGS